MKKQILFLLVAGTSVLYLQECLSADAKKILGRDGYALYKAAYMGRASKVKRLIEKGVNPNIQSPNSQRTPLHIAAARGNLGITEALINHNANPNIKNKQGKTPLDFAIEKNRTQVIEFLIKHGAHISPEMLEKAHTDDIKDILQKGNQAASEEA